MNASEVKGDDEPVRLEDSNITGGEAVANPEAYPDPGDVLEAELKLADSATSDSGLQPLKDSEVPLSTEISTAADELPTELPTENT